MAKPTVHQLIRALNSLGFEVSLRPITPAARPSLAERVDATLATPATETVEIGGDTFTRLVGSVSDDAPHGVSPDGKPLAPFGMLADGSRPRKSAAGRPRSSEPTPAPKAQPAPKVAQPSTGGLSLDLSAVLGAGPAPAPAPVAQPQPEPEPVPADLDPAAVLDDLELSLANL